LDDWDARVYATDIGLEITGTLGILIAAHEKGILPDIRAVIDNLRQHRFRLPANIESLISK
jgi:predicted nucleic acid-binding protein